MSTTQTKSNLFAKAKKVETASSTSKKEKKTFTLPEAEYPGISANLKEYEEVTDTIKNAETRKEVLEGKLKDIGQALWLDEYEIHKMRPESFCIAGERGGKLMFLMMDKYINIPETSEGDALAEQLKDKFGDEILSSTETYMFDTDLLNKYMDAISEAIQNIPDYVMPEEAKGALIKLKQKHKVTSGSIERLMQYDEDKRREFVTLLAPQRQLKNAR